MHGDAADEMVRMVLNGTEVAIKLTGSAAKNLAALLVAWSKNEKKVYGKTTMMKLLKSGEPLQVLSMTKEQYSKFKGMAKKKVLYAPFLNKKRGDNKLDVVISEKSLPMVNHILKKIGYGEVAKTQPEVEETKKKRYSVEAKLKRCRGQVGSAARHQIQRKADSAAAEGFRQGQTGTEPQTTSAEESA